MNIIEHPVLHRIRGTRRSFYLGRTLPQALATWLEAHEFKRITPRRARFTFGYWQRGTNQIVIHHNNIVDIQGPNGATCVQLLAPLIKSEVQV